MQDNLKFYFLKYKKWACEGWSYFYTLITLISKHYYNIFIFYNIAMVLIMHKVYLKKI